MPKPPRALRLAADPAEAPAIARPSVRVKTAARDLDMNERDVRALVDSGALEGHRVGTRGIRIYVDAIEAYQRARPTGTTQRPVPAKKTRTARHAAHREALAYLDGLGLLSPR